MCIRDRLQRGRHDLERKALDLDVHLDRRDAGLGARDLEVHVAEVILGAQDVGQDRDCLLYTSPSPRDRTRSRMPSSA